MSVTSMILFFLLFIFQFNTWLGIVYLPLCRIHWQFLLLCRKFRCQTPKGIKSRNKKIFKQIRFEQMLHGLSVCDLGFDHDNAKINARVLLTAVNSSLSSPISSRIVLHSAPRKLRRLTAWIAEPAFLSKVAS